MFSSWPLERNKSQPWSQSLSLGARSCDQVPSLLWAPVCTSLKHTDGCTASTVLMRIKQDDKCTAVKALGPCPAYCELWVNSISIKSRREWLLQLLQLHTRKTVWCINSYIDMSLYTAFCATNKRTCLFSNAKSLTKEITENYTHITSAPFPPKEDSFSFTTTGHLNPGRILTTL